MNLQAFIEQACRHAESPMQVTVAQMARFFGRRVVAVARIEGMQLADVNTSDVLPGHDAVIAFSHGEYVAYPAGLPYRDIWLSGEGPSAAVNGAAVLALLPAPRPEDYCTCCIHSR